MSMNEIRAFLANFYPGQEWKNKLNRMSDSQAYAIYRSILSRGDKPKTKPTTSQQYHQIGIDEIVTFA